MDLSGLYRYYYNDSGPSSYFLPKVSYRYIRFYPEGRFYNDLPREGFANFDYKGACQKDPINCGVYSFQGDTGIMRFATNPQLYQWPIQRVNGQLFVKGGKADPLAPCDGLLLEGSFRGDFDPNHGVAFSRDGRFQDNALLVALQELVQDQYGSYESAPVAPGAGTYRIRQNTIEFGWSDSRRAVFSFYLDPEESRETPKKIYVNRYSFSRA